MVRIEEGVVAAHVANNETQVLNKRKPVNLITSPPNVPDNTEVRQQKFHYTEGATDTRSLLGLCHERHQRSVHRLREVPKTVMFTYIHLMHGHIY